MDIALRAKAEGASLKLSDDLPPCRIATAEGPLDVPCRWRWRGLAVTEIASGFAVTHEGSGTRIGREQDDGHHALGVACALLTLPLDWRGDVEALRADAGTMNEEQRSLLAAIVSGQVQMIDLSKPQGKA